MVEWAKDVFQQNKNLFDEFECNYFSLLLENARGTAFKELQDFERSLESHLSAAASGEWLVQNHGCEDLDVVLATGSNLINLATVLDIQLKPAESLPVFKEAAEFLEQSLVRFPNEIGIRKLIVTTNSNWCNSLIRLKSWDLVEAKLRNVIQMLDELIIEVPRNQEYKTSLTINHGKLASFYFRTNQAEKGLIANQAAIELGQKTIDSTLRGQGVLIRQFELKLHLLRLAKRTEESIEAADEVILIADKYLADFPGNPKLLNHLANIYVVRQLSILELNQVDEYFQKLDQTYDALDRAGPQST